VDKPSSPQAYLAAVDPPLIFPTPSSLGTLQVLDDFGWFFAALIYLLFIIYYLLFIFYLFIIHLSFIFILWLLRLLFLNFKLFFTTPSSLGTLKLAFSNWFLPFLLSSLFGY
jgi:hypothetical protein